MYSDKMPVGDWIMQKIVPQLAPHEFILQNKYAINANDTDNPLDFPYLNTRLVKQKHTPCLHFEELAVSSQIGNIKDMYIHDKRYIPMFDGAGVPDNYNEVHRELEYVTNYPWTIFNSGNSFHAYSNVLVNYERMVELLGTVIRYLKCIDHKWVGAFLLTGNNFLRVTNNTKPVPYRII